MSILYEYHWLSDEVILFANGTSNYSVHFTLKKVHVTDSYVLSQ